MGNQQSTQTKEDTRRSNRLSKPLTKKLALSSPQLSREEYETASGLVRWENNWATNLPEVKNFQNAETKELPTTLFESKSATPEKHKRASASIAPIDPLTPSSSSAISRAGKRASQPVISPISTQFSRVSPHPRRANSVQINLERNGSVIYESPVEDATSSNTHFLVDNQRFSLTRRRSLLTRPGVATRRTTGAIRRVPSPIGEPDLDESPLQAWALPPRRASPRRSGFSQRPTSPADARYTQLGALKLGSLRVVNGSASPCPSERIPLERAIVGSGLGLQNVEPICTKAAVELPLVSDVKKSDDPPASPFSFEKSPIISVPSRSKTLPTKEMEDEGIAMCDETMMEKNEVEMLLDRSTSRSVNKSDSGYSSATSLHSVQRSRASFDSQTSASGIADDKIQRHLGVEEKVGNYSRPRPTSTRWYDGRGPNPQTRPGGVRRSTLCAPRYTEYPTQERVAPEDFPSPYPFFFQESQTISSRGRLYADRCSKDMKLPLNTSYNSSPSTSLERANSLKQSADSRVKSRMHRSASEHHLNRRNKEEAEAFRSRSRSRPSGRVWSQRPGIEAPPLPTILSPGIILSGEEEKDAGFPPTEHRGRPRSRSQDYRRRKLTKLRPQPSIQMATSTVSIR